MACYPNRGINAAVIASSIRNVKPEYHYRKGTEISIVSFDFDPDNADGYQFMTTVYIESI